MKGAFAPARPRPVDLTLYLVTDGLLAGPRGIVETVRAAIAGGVTLVQLRDPEAPTRRLVAEARALKSVLDPLRVPLIINDRVDVALAAGAAGVHVGQSDMDAADARRLLGPDAIIGLSVGTPGEFRASTAAREHVDYLGVGPVFATGTKADAGEAIGPEGVRAMRALTDHPFVAIGGLDASRAALAIAAGADGVAVVSAVMAATDPRAAARALRTVIDAARARSSTGTRRAAGGES